VLYFIKKGEKYLPKTFFSSLYTLLSPFCRPEEKNIDGDLITP